jgi:hypothetical protein
VADAALLRTENGIQHATWRELFEEAGLVEAR